MRITTRGRYALRASLALAKLGKDRKAVPVNELAEEEDISPVFLEQIFFRLRKAGIVHSIRGPGGGFCFARDLDHLTIREILDAAGEDLNITACDRNVKKCGHIGDCLSHRVWEDLSNIVNDYFAGITLGSIVEEYHAPSAAAASGVATAG
jgi:Rrf2 family iron-sulfur cluster assembly transcriptional regulator